MSVSFVQRGDNLADFVRAAHQAGASSHEEAVRMTAFAARNEIRRIAKTRLGTSWRVWNARGFASTIRCKRIGQGVYRVYSSARYKQNRTDLVDLLWVFDNAPVVRSGTGKKYVAVPVKGQAPIYLNGRRVMWPSEATRAGWQLDFVRIMGKASILVLGRRNKSEAWRPLWILLPQTRMPKRFDLEGIYQKHASRMDTLWGDLVDKKLARRTLQLAA